MPLTKDGFRPNRQVAGIVPVNDVVPELPFGNVQVPGQGALDLRVAGAGADIQLALGDIQAPAIEANVHDRHAALSFRHDAESPRCHADLLHRVIACHKKTARTSSKSSFTPRKRHLSGSVGFELTRPARGRALTSLYAHAVGCELCLHQ